MGDVSENDPVFEPGDTVVDYNTIVYSTDLNFTVGIVLGFGDYAMLHVHWPNRRSMREMRSIIPLDREKRELWKELIAPNDCYPDDANDVNRACRHLDTLEDGSWNA